jgi:hypothetical protein
MNNAIMESDSPRRLRSDKEGAAFLEFTVFVGAFFTILFGIIDFTFAYYQWNAATKAVQVGARLAAVSDPVASNLKMPNWDVAGYESGSVVPLDDGFTHVCSVVDGVGDCTNGGTYDADAMNTIVFGRGNTECNGTAPNIGMCNIFWRITPENVRVTYEYTGLGFAGRATGPVPTIKVEVVGIPFRFFLVGALAGLNDIEIPGLMSTITGENLSSSGSSTGS